MRTFSIARSMLLGAAFCFGHANAGVDQTEVGRLKNIRGSAVMLVLNVDGQKMGAIYVADRYNVKTNLIELNRDNLIALRDLIDTTLAQLEAKQ